MRLLAGIVGLVLLLAVTGCPNRTKQNSSTTVSKVATDPWATAVRALSRSDDQPLPEFRRILESLNSELATNPEAAAPAKRPEAQISVIESLLPNLSADDKAEINSPTFTRFDSNYYAECLFLRDATRALELNDATPLEKATTVFDWVCRQVYLHQANFRGQFVPNMPPVIVLKRGWGNETERAMLTLRAFQIVGLDACLIGLPGSETQKSEPTPGNPPTFRQPFWGVGVKVDDGVLVFHLKTGKTARRADGQPARLAELVTTPDLAKDWFAGDFNADVLKKSVPVLALPISAMGQRWTVLESKLDTPINLGIDPIALRDKFGPSVKFWNPPSDEFDLAHGLMRVTPKADGGREMETQQAVVNLDKIAQMPTQVFAIPGELQNLAAREYIAQRLITVYGESFIEGTSPKERIARGLFFDVTKDLVEKENRFAQAANRYETQQSNVGDLRNYLIKLNDLYFALEGAQNRKDSTKTVQLQAELEKHTKDNTKMQILLFDGLLGLPGSAEATYLLALNKQEIAERFQLRANRAERQAETAAKVPMADPKKVAEIQALADKARQQANESWAAARDWWDRYDRYRDAHGQAFPGRAEHAKAMAEKARVSGR